MEFQRLFELGECPILLSSGEIGMIIRWDDVRNEVGVQIPGADNIEWVHTSKINCDVGALVEAADEIPGFADIMLSVARTEAMCLRLGHDWSKPPGPKYCRRCGVISDGEDGK